jgi:hypothetical protein
MSDQERVIEHQINTSAISNFAVDSQADTEKERK